MQTQSRLQGDKHKLTHRDHFTNDSVQDVDKAAENPHHRGKDTQYITYCVVTVKTIAKEKKVTDRHYFILHVVALVG